MRLRTLVFKAALETEGVGRLEELLKWGEPSYLTRGGSTIRMAWKASKPNQYTLNFNFNTSLIATFKELYADELKFEGNRAIVFNGNDELPHEALKSCIALSLCYHRIKHLPMLGV